MLFEKLLLKWRLLALCFLLFFVSVSEHSMNAQSPTDHLFMGSKNVCFLFNTDVGRFDEYWEGDKLRKNETVATVHRYTSSTMAAIGILDRLDVYLGVPYVITKSSKPNGGKFTGVSNFQDFMVGAKYGLIHKEFSEQEFNLIVSAGYATPVSNYLSDYMPYSLGLGAPEASARGIVEYTSSLGIYVRGMFGHLWRGYAEAERDYYYNDGSYYTKWMDVPDAWNYEGALGLYLLDKDLRMEVTYTGLRSKSGDDIRAYNAAQPTNKVETDRVGFFAQYYVGKTGFGALVYHNRVIDGMNAAKMANTGIGITYQFSFKKKS